MVDESLGQQRTADELGARPRRARIVSQMMRLSYRQSVDRERGLHPQRLRPRRLGDGDERVALADAKLDPEIDGSQIDKIVNTMLEFGPDYRYVVMGYPPFLKCLADDRRIDWSQYVVDAGFGGEGISESLRTYLQRTFKRVVGSYGASDLEVNMAVETELTIRLRRAVTEDARLRDALIRAEYGVTPMIFQYNPLAYYLETNDKGELLATMSRPYHIAPKIRYNIHDRGHVMRLPELRRRLAAAGRSDLLDGFDRAIDLPLLFLYGRSDMSIDYYGANVTPDSLREVLYGIDALAPILNTFRLLAYENEKHDKCMEIAAEMVAGAAAPADMKDMTKEVFSRLAKINGDFYNAYYNTAPPENPPYFNLYAFETGPFAGGQRKLKNEYVASDLKYDKL